MDGRLVGRSAILILGFVVVSLGLALMLQSTLGMGPWGAFQAAIARLSGLTVGRATQLCSVAILLVAWFLGVAPTLASVINMVAVGLFMDRFLAILPAVQTWSQSIIFFALGLFIYCLGVAIYLKAGLGSGPRESLMLAIHQRFRVSIRLSRTLIDGTILLVSAVFRGPVGIGTVVYAVSCGPLIQSLMTLLSVDPGQTEPTSL